ncbi:Ig-like domain-containing protein, partial [Pectobacterium cacticida]|uniref:Ig-like domain-containing protein n=1 Tax=Pectobacterium cacticida TaxID=69221 RepID=UPI002FF3B9B5
MNNISITEKDNGQVSLVNTPTGEIVLSSPSIVKLQLDRNDIASMTRSGNDLVVTLHSGERVVLKNFYAAGEQGASELVLEESDGALWWIKNPAEQSQFEAITSLDDIMSGYAEAEGGGFSNLWMGLGALAGLTGGVIALASGGGNNRHDTTPPDAPTDLAVAGDGTTVSGNAEPGSNVTVTDGGGNTLGSVEVGEDGSFTVPLNPPPTNGESLTVIVSDAAGNSSSTTVTAPDTTAPDVPTDLAVAGDGTTVSGNAEPGSTVTVTDGDGNTLGSVEVGEDGSFTVPLNQPPTNGESLTVIVSDAASNSSSTTITAPDTTAPDAPTDLAVAGDGTAISGNAEPGSTVTVTDGGG